MLGNILELIKIFYGKLIYKNKYLNEFKIELGIFNTRNPKSIRNLTKMNYKFKIKHKI